MTAPCSCFETTLRVLEHRFHLREFDARKPLQELLDSGADFNIFEQRLYRYAGTLEKPGATDLSRYLFHGRAL